MRTGNPVLSHDVFRIEHSAAAATTMTIAGTVTKTAILLAITIAGAAVSWVHVDRAPELAMPYIWGGIISGLIFAVATTFKPAWSPVTAPIYALCEGLFLGAISLFADAYARQISGTSIVPQAVILTFGTLASLLVAYRAGLIRATERFRTGVIAATGGIAIVYLATIVLHMFGVSIPYIHGSGMIGIGFSVFVVIVAALNLVLDFDFIETGVQQTAPKYMEWYGAFGLLVTLVWLYIEFLRLLMKLQRRN
ncbi:MAG: Bax inhibitor-1/YccA family protein [Pirellulales bacterium]